MGALGGARVHVGAYRGVACMCAIFHVYTLVDAVEHVGAINALLKRHMSIHKTPQQR